MYKPIRPPADLPETTGKQQNNNNTGACKMLVNQGIINTFSQYSSVIPVSSKENNVTATIANFPMGWRLAHSEEIVLPFQYQNIDFVCISPEWLEENFKYFAFVRYLEIWGKVTQPEFMRGMKGTRKLEMSFAGMIGALNSKKRIYRDDNGYWKLADPDIYPEVPRLDQSGIATAKKFASILN